MIGVLSMNHACRKTGIRAIRLVTVTAAFLLFTSCNLNEALVEAVQSADIHRVRKLLERGADVNATTTTGATPLMMAAESGDPELVSLILEYSPLLDVMNRDERSALILASRGADITLETDGGHTAFDIASANSRTVSLSLLFERGQGEVSERLVMAYVVAVIVREMSFSEAARAVVKGRRDAGRVLEIAKSLGHDRFAQELRAAGAAGGWPF